MTEFIRVYVFERPKGDFELTRKIHEIRRI